MLVLARRPGQRIFFPNLDIWIQVLNGKGNTIRPGIEAPSNIDVVREEAIETTPACPRSPSASIKPIDRHALFGQLNTLTMALHVSEKQLKAEMTADAERSIQEAQSVLETVSTSFVATPVRETRKPTEALLVEDNPNEESLLSDYLRLSGFRVNTVHDGYEALEFLASHKRPAFVLMDMRLPRYDGPLTISTIRGNPEWQGMRIFAVTGGDPGEFDLPTGEKGVMPGSRNHLIPDELSKR